MPYPAAVDASFVGWFNHWAAGFQALPTAFQYTFVILLGLAIGSFLTVVVHRLPLMLERAWRAEIAELAADEQARPSLQADDTGPPVDAAPAYNLCTPRSACPSCSTPLRVRDNLPLLGYLLRRGRCARCGARIGLQYPLLETAAALLAALTYWRYGSTLQGLAGFGFGAALLALGFIDANTRLLPDALTLPLLWAGLLLNLAGAFATPTDAVVGAAAGYLSLWLVYWLFRLLRGKEGIGYGDFKLLAAIGAWFGWTVLPQVVLLSSFAGAAFGLAALARRRLQAGEPLPFGPFIAAAGLLTLLYGNLLYDAHVF